MAQFKMSMRDEDIAMFRTQLHSHRLNLQIVLQLINVHVSTLMPASIPAQMIPKLNSLIALATREQAQRECSTAPDDDPKTIIRDTRQLLETAQRHVAKVTSVANDQHLVELRERGDVIEHYE